MSESVDIPVVDDASLQIDFDTPVIPQQQQQTGNPAWNDVMGIIPKEFHAQVTPHFQQWDKNVQELLQKAKDEAVKPYQAYKQFVDERVNPQELLTARQIFQMINSDPLAVYQRLQATLKQNGLLQDEQQNLEEQQQQTDPRIDQLMQMQQAFIDNFQNQQQQAQQQQVIQEFAQRADTQIKTEFQTIANAVNGGKELPEWLRVELLDRAALMTDRMGHPVSLIEAYQELQSLQKNIRTGQRQAPQIVTAGGGFPQQQPNMDALKTPEGKDAAVRAIIERFNQNS